MPAHIIIWVMECYQWVVWMMLLICRILWWVKVMCCREVVVILQRGYLRMGATVHIHVCNLNFKSSHFAFWIGAHVAVSILPLILYLLVAFTVSTHLHVIPLSPNSAQNQFSPNNIHRLSWAKSRRINKMITKRKIFDLLPNSLN